MSLPRKTGFSGIGTRIVREKGKNRGRQVFSTIDKISIYDISEL
jgi:hypothetical protein